MKMSINWLVCLFIVVNKIPLYGTSMCDYTLASMSTVHYSLCILKLSTKDWVEFFLHTLMHVWEALFWCSLISFFGMIKCVSLRLAMTDLFYKRKRMFVGCVLLSISYSQDNFVDHREESALAPLPSLEASLSRGERPQQ